MATRGSNLVRRYNYVGGLASDASAQVAGASWIHLPVEGTPEGTREIGIDTAAVSNARGNDSVDYPTVRKGGISGLVIPTFGGNVGLDGAGGDSAPTTVFLQALLENYFNGTFASHAGTTTSTNGIGSSGDPLDVTSATGITVGSALMVNGEFRFVESISGTAVVLNQPLSAAPSNGDVVYGGFSIGVTLGNSVDHYLAINEELANGEGTQYYAGEVMALQLTGLAAGNGLKWNIGFESNTWTDEVTPSSFTANAYTAAPVVAAAGEVLVNGTATCISDGSVDFGVRKEWVPCSTGEQGRDGVEVFGASPTATITEYYTASRLTQYTGRTGIDVMFAFSNGSTNAAKARHAIAVWMPNAQVMTAGAAVGNLRGMSTTFNARDPDSTQVAAGITSPIYLAIFGGRA